MTSSLLKNLFDSHKESSLENRYIHLEHITPLIENLKMSFQVDVIGHSVLGKPIHVIKIGTGPKKILMWSQMHGNESTTTKAVFDICNVFNDGSNSIIKHILETCTMFLVPMLNPDGSKLYTRHNANNVDLNRDAKNLSQPESRVLRACSKLLNQIIALICMDNAPYLVQETQPIRLLYLFCHLLRTRLVP